MSQFQNVISTRDSHLKIQTLISVMFIDATMPMPELTRWKMYLDKQDKKNSSVGSMLYFCRLLHFCG